MRAAVVIPAGGAGLRMGGRVGAGRKQYLELAGEPVLLRAIRPFLDHPAIETVVVALPPEDVADPPVTFPPGVTVVAGGRERGDSVRRALARVPAEVEVVMVHDGARPLVTGDVVDRTLRAVLPAAGGTAGAGAIAAVPVADTLKRVDADRAVTETVDRRDLWRAQTPQAFPRALLVEAYRRAAEEAFAGTDDASLVERYGGRVVVVEGDVRNLKITRPNDLALAELLLRAQEQEPEPVDPR